ncbi:MAG: hypothetical protein AABZ53_02215 [Planctomycetota bacterium]
MNFASTLLAALAICIQPASQPPTSALPPADPPANPSATADPLAQYNALLAALDPAHPEAYFELAETIADAAQTVDESTLARRLYILAFELDRARPGIKSGSLGASICIGLASLSRLERDRRWLLALAGTLDPRYRPPAWLRSQQDAASAQTAYFAATALGEVRAGNGIQARQLLEDPLVKLLLTQYDRLLSESGQFKLLSSITSEANLWPCRECANQRIVKRTSRAADYKLCPTCGGNPGPKLADGAYLAQLRLESLLLAGIQRSWSAQVTADQGEPLRDPDPAELAPTYSVDPTLTVWREGKWQKP